MWWWDIVQHWGAVCADLSQLHHIDLHDPTVLARPWPGVRDLIFDLLSVPTSRLAVALGGRP